MIISVSTDGVMCSWTTDMLARPQEFLELTYPPPTQSTTTTLMSKVVEDLSPMSVSFSRNDSGSFFVGTEEGSIWSINRYDRAGAKAGTDGTIRFTPHHAPVTKLDLHRAGLGPGTSETCDFDNLLLSASLDWTIRLYRTRTSPSVTGDIRTNAPLMEWGREDMVYDVAWSPVRPSLFTSVDGSGTLELWDLTSPDPEVPVAWTRDPEHPRALNKVCWETGPEGRRVVTGSLDGRVQVYDLGAEYGAEGSGGKDEVLGIKKFLARCEGERLGSASAGILQRERSSSLSWR
jgi:dynein intermediate chain, cytosolic